MTEWNVDKAKDEIANGGRYGAKRVMEAVYRNNIDVFRHWGYRLPDGRLVGLGDRSSMPSSARSSSRFSRGAAAHATQSRRRASSRRSTRLSADGRKFSERTNMKVDTAARFLAAACVVR